MEKILECNPVAGDDLSIKLFCEAARTSVVTMLFTDIKSFTPLFEVLGESKTLQYVQQHDDILTSIIERDQLGKVINTAGDCFIAVFDKPSVAVDRAIEIQKRLEQWNQKQSVPPAILVRMGLHSSQGIYGADGII
jgi:class 3 adenylate cyclase